MRTREELLELAEQIESYCTNQLRIGCTKEDIIEALDAEIINHRNRIIRDKIPKLIPEELSIMKEVMLNPPRKVEETYKRETLKRGRRKKVISDR